MPTFIVINSANEAMKVSGTLPIFIKDARLANKYSSNYQARKHLRRLDNVPNDVKIIELSTLEG